MRGSPVPLPVPTVAPTIADGQIVMSAGAGAPLIWKFTLAKSTGPWSWIQPGSNVTFIGLSDSPTNLGIYGPNPTVLGIDPATGKTSGRMRAPKLGNPDATSYRCEGNFAPGVYYLVIQTGDNRAPVGNASLALTVRSWQVFG